MNMTPYQALCTHKVSIGRVTKVGYTVTENAETENIKPNNRSFNCNGRAQQPTLCNVYSQPLQWKLIQDFWYEAAMQSSERSRLLSADPNMTDLLQKEHPQILTGIGGVG